MKNDIERLKRQSMKMAYLLDSLEHGLMIVDKNDNLSQWNKAAKLFIKNKEAESGDPFELIDFCKQVEIASKNCILNNVSSLFDIEDKENGRIFSVNINPFVSPVIGNGSLVVISDVTEIRNADQIRQEFVANASHELKTPVTSIRGFAELLSNNLVNDEEKKKEYLDRIMHESDRISNIVKDILILSSLENEKTLKNIQKVDMLDIVQDIARTLNISAHKKVTIEVLGDRLYTMADPEDMIHLVSNLVENAVKYSNDGGKVTITVEKDKNKLVLGVSDNGIGIPSADMPRIFERFYRVDNARTRSQGGTGLGLAIVKNIVAAYSGVISIKSELFEGTDIRVQLDLA